jgi:glutamyl-tRNA synthetase
LYQQYAVELINSGNAYYAFDTEALDAARKLEEEQGKRLFTIIPTEKNWTLLLVICRETAKRIAAANIMSSVLKLR